MENIQESPVEASLPYGNADIPEAVLQPTGALSVRPSGSYAGDYAGDSVELQKAFVLGTLRADFPNEARRDSITDHMKSVWAELLKSGKTQRGSGAGEAGSAAGEPSAKSAYHLFDYLKAYPERAEAVTWVLYRDLTPLYAVQPEGPFAREAYAKLVEYYGDFHTAEGAKKIERIAVAGHLTGRRVRLLDGVEVRVIRPDLRGFASWSTQRLVDEVLKKISAQKAEGAASGAAENRPELIRQFAQRIYDEMLNLGVDPQHRALNFSATESYVATKTIVDAAANKEILHRIEAVRSPVCRPGSDCWDVVMSFITDNYAKTDQCVSYMLTVDVSDTVPVMLAGVRKRFISCSHLR